MSRRELYRTLESLVAEAVSPDGIITATVANGQAPRLRLLPRTFADYDVIDLESQLTTVVTAAFRGYREARRDFRERHGLGGRGRRDGSGLTVTASDLTAHASSDRDWVRVWTRGLTQWRFALADNVVRSLSATQFVDEAHSAVATTIDDYNRQLRVLRTRRPD